MTVHQYNILLDWELLNSINQIERFDAAWEYLAPKEGQNLPQLKTLAMVKSLGAVTRLKGGYLNDKDVEDLLRQKNRFVIQGKIAQEAIGYYEAFKNVLDNYKEIPIAEHSIINFHAILFKYNQEEFHRRGIYRHVSQVVTNNTPATATTREGFKTTMPTLHVENLMRQLLQWFQQDKTSPALVKCAVFAYNFLSTKPFEYGSQRLSNILLTLLLLKSGYSWVQYVSIELALESKQTEYERILRRCQNQENQDISAWILFIMDLLGDLQNQLLQKLKMSGTQSALPVKHKAILLYIETHPGCQSGHIAGKLGIANSTVKRMLKELLDQNLVKRYGAGAGISYTVV